MIPPPIPMTPETKPKIPPMGIEMNNGTSRYALSLFSYFLTLTKSNIPAKVRDEKSPISNIRLLISSDPPINAKGTEPSK